jgi:tetratricopeptide (TPR) repeat protein
LGKTQMAVEYAYEYTKDYPNGVIWINADQDMEAQLIEIAERAAWVSPITEHHYKLEIARRRLRSFSDCLIIFDNVEKIQELHEYMPEAPANPHILITSRTEQPGFTPIPLDLLGLEDALRMLFQETGKQPEAGPEQEAAATIAQLLGGLPLALELAGAYLRHRPIKWTEYRDYLVQNLRAATKMPIASFTRHEADLFAALQVSQGALAQEPHLHEILDILTWGGTAPMSRDLLAALLDTPSANLTGALSLGQSLRLITKVPEGEVYSIHRLLQEVRRQQTPLDNKRDWFKNICRKLGIYFQERRKDISLLMQWESDIDQLRAWQGLSRNWAPQEASRLNWLLAYPLAYRGDWRQSLNYLLEARACFWQEKANDRALEANLDDDLGFLCGRLGNYPAQLVFYGKAFAQRWEIFGERHPDTATSLNNLGVAYGELGNYQKQLEYCQEALELRKEIHGEKHSNTARTFNDLGDAYGNLGNYQKQLEYYQLALKIREEIHEVKHPNTAQSLNKLGIAYGNLGDHQKQLEYCGEAFELTKEIYGEKHPNTAQSLNNMGLAYGNLRIYQKQLEYSRQALELSKEILGEKHPDIAECLNNLGCAYGNLGDYQTKLDYCQQALDLSKEILGETHPQNAFFIGNIGDSFFHLNNIPKAKEYAEKAYSLWRETLGDQHPHTVKSAINLSTVLVRQNHYYPAFQLLNNAIKQLPINHLRYVEIKKALEEVRAKVPGFGPKPGTGKSSKKKRKKR